MKRPAGFIVLSLIMAWLGLAGVANFWFVLNAVEPWIPKYFAPLILAYGIAALATMCGLWLMRRWVLVAIQTWMAICGLFVLTYGLYYNPAILGGIFGIIGAVVFMSVLFAFIYGYVEKTMQAHG